MMAAGSALVTKRITPQAYEALADALSAVYWYKAPFERHLRLALHDHPEVLARLDFSNVKRAVAGALVQMLATDARYHQVTLQMMLDLADMTTFAHLATLPDAAHLTARATAAVAHLCAMTRTYRHDLDQQQRLLAQQRAGAAHDAARQRESGELADIKAQFLALGLAASPQERGRQFERVLYRLFDLCDMQPRLAYNLPSEQIDGSFTFDTDDYLVEAKWCKSRVEREQADVFAAKIGRKGRNTLGLFVSVSGYTEGFLTIPHAGGCPFVTLDGEDLFLVLDGRVALQDAIRRKRRHLNDTGSCHLPARTMTV